MHFIKARGADKNRIIVKKIRAVTKRRKESERIEKNHILKELNEKKQFNGTYRKKEFNLNGIFF